MNKEEIKTKQNIDFIKDLFLTCPNCNTECFIHKLNKNSFITKCDCTKWKVSFKIEEV